jgi:agmatine deiminase
MKKIFSLFLLLLSFNISHSQNGSDFYMPAEWEKHEAVWVGWETFGPFQQPTLNVIKALLPYIPVKVVADTRYGSQVAKEYLQMQGVDSSKVQFHIMRDNRVWLRDHGSSFLVNAKRELAVADFRWTLYGIKDWLSWNTNDPASVDIAYAMALKKTGKIDSLMGVIEKARNISTSVSMEGGSIEVNGKGVLILNETVTMQRNPGVKKEFLEAEFKRVLGAKKIIWMKRGLADDPHIIRPITGIYVGFGTGGHTDEFVRFADARTILLAWVDESEKDLHPISKMNYERMQENLKILEASTDQDDLPFRIIKVPLPHPIEKKVLMVNYQKNEFDDGVLVEWFSPDAGFKAGDTVIRVAASSYLNYLVTNNVVLLPTYIKEGSSSLKEEKIKQIMKEAFPGRELIFLEIMSLNYEGGGIHCITQQQPAR